MPEPVIICLHEAEQCLSDWQSVRQGPCPESNNIQTRRCAVEQRSSSSHFRKVPANGFQAGTEAEEHAACWNRHNKNGQKRQAEEMDKNIGEAPPVDDLRAVALGETSRENSTRVDRASFGSRPAQRFAFQLLSCYSSAARKTPPFRTDCVQEVGSGTTAVVAEELGRRAILCELAPHYLPLIEQRLAASTPGLALT